MKNQTEVKEAKEVFAIYSQESNWELWPEREYRLLSDLEVEELPEEYSSMWSLNWWTVEQAVQNLQGLADQGNWTADQVLKQISES